MDLGGVRLLVLRLRLLAHSFGGNRWGLLRHAATWASGAFAHEHVTSEGLATNEDRLMRYAIAVR